MQGEKEKKNRVKKRGKKKGEKEGIFPPLFVVIVPPSGQHFND